jgi:tRNA-dihydrouridine synthase 1
MLTRSFMDKSNEKPLLAYSPMIHARIFRESPALRSSFLLTPRTVDGKETVHLDGNPAFDRPLIVQFCANDPQDFLESARIVAPYCDAVDLNLGCPQGIAKKGNYGAFLQEDWDLIYKLINKLHNELEVPVTAKFRIQESKQKTLAYAKMILSAGASIITVHGRRREQKGHNTGVADWSYIRYLRDHLPSETVIFANGNILNSGDLERCLRETGADGVMSAEGNLSDPSIFSQPPLPGSEGREYWRRNGKEGYRVDAVFRRYLDIIYSHILKESIPKRHPLFLPTDPVDEQLHPKPDIVALGHDGDGHGEGPPKKRRKHGEEQRTNNPNLVAMQGHLFQLLRPLVTKHTHIRDALAKARRGDLPVYENILRLVEEAVKEGMLEYEQFPDRFDIPPKEKEQLKGSKATIAEYGRPWWICQPYVRPLPEEAIQTGALTANKKTATATSEISWATARGVEKSNGTKRIAQTSAKADTPTTLGATQIDRLLPG